MAAGDPWNDPKASNELRLAPPNPPGYDVQPTPQNALALYQQGVARYQQDVNASGQSLARHQRRLAGHQQSLVRQQHHLDNYQQHQQQFSQQSQQLRTGPIATNLIQTITNRENAISLSAMFQNIGISNTYDSNTRQQTERIDITFREQVVLCISCRRPFANEEARIRHKRNYPSGCVACRRCFGSHHNIKHAEEYEHERCFVVTCASRSMGERCWDDEVVERHVKKEHGLQRRS